MNAYFKMTLLWGLCWILPAFSVDAIPDFVVLSKDGERIHVGRTVWKNGSDVHIKYGSWTSIRTSGYRYSCWPHKYRRFMPTFAWRYAFATIGLPYTAPDTASVDHPMVIAGVRREGKFGARGGKNVPFVAIRSAEQNTFRTMDEYSNYWEKRGNVSANVTALVRSNSLVYAAGSIWKQENDPTKKSVFFEQRAIYIHAMSPWFGGNQTGASERYEIVMPDKFDQMTVLSLAQKNNTLYVAGIGQKGGKPKGLFVYEIDTHSRKTVDPNKFSYLPMIEKGGLHHNPEKGELSVSVNQEGQLYVVAQGSTGLYVTRFDRGFSSFDHTFGKDGPGRVFISGIFKLHPMRPFPAPTIDGRGFVSVLGRTAEGSLASAVLKENGTSISSHNFEGAIRHSMGGRELVDPASCDLSIIESWYGQSVNRNLLYW